MVHQSKHDQATSRELHTDPRIVYVGDVAIGGKEVVIIAGLDLNTNGEQLFAIAQSARELGAKLIYGGSYRSAESSGLPGVEQGGLELLTQLRQAANLGIILEVTSRDEVAQVAPYADALLVGAYNMHNERLLSTLARSCKPVILKRSPAATIEEWHLAATYLMAQGNTQIILCESGIRTFAPEFHTMLDLSAVAYTKQVLQIPVMTDPGQGAAPETVLAMALASVACGADGLLVELQATNEQADAAIRTSGEGLRHIIEHGRAVGRAIGRTVGYGPTTQA